MAMTTTMTTAMTTTTAMTMTSSPLLESQSLQLPGTPGSSSGGRLLLIPALPDDVSLRILARLPRRAFLALALVSRGWRRALASQELFDIRRELGRTEEWLYIQVREEEEEEEEEEEGGGEGEGGSLSWYAVDPESGAWQRLPPLPEAAAAAAADADADADADAAAEEEEEEEEEDGGFVVEGSSKKDREGHGWWWWWWEGIAKGLLLAAARWKKKAGGGRRGSRRSRWAVKGGCAAAACAGDLFVVGGFSDRGGNRAVATVRRYDPRANAWREAAPMREPRAYCKAAVVAGKLYAVGGVDKILPPGAEEEEEEDEDEEDGAAAGNGGGAGSSIAMGAGLVPLRSAEVYDPCSDRWQPIPSMPLSRAQAVARAHAQSHASTAAAAAAHHHHHQHQHHHHHQHQHHQHQHHQHQLQHHHHHGLLLPMAAGIAALGGRLCVPQSLYSWPFFVDAGGELFDPASASWLAMPPGMADGWPAKQAGTKLAVSVAGRLFALDPTASQDDDDGAHNHQSGGGSGSKIRVYDELADAWKPLPLAKLPVVLDDFSASDCPFLLAAFRTGLHVVAKDIDDRIVVLRAAADAGAATATATAAKPTTESWKIVATKKFGSSVELLTCQVLEV